MLITSSKDKTMKFWRFKQLQAIRANPNDRNNLVGGERVDGVTNRRPQPPRRDPNDYDDYGEDDRQANDFSDRRPQPPKNQANRDRNDPLMDDDDEDDHYNQRQNNGRHFRDEAPQQPPQAPKQDPRKKKEEDSDEDLAGWDT